MTNVCRAFQKNSDGTWTSIVPVRIAGPVGDVQVPPVMTFFPGEDVLGFDVAAWLEENCGEICGLPSAGLQPGLGLGSLMKAS